MGYVGQQNVVEAKMALQNKLSDNLQHFLALLTTASCSRTRKVGYSIHMCKCCKILGSIG